MSAFLFGFLGKDPLLHRKWCYLRWRFVWGEIEEGRTKKKRTTFWNPISTNDLEEVEMPQQWGRGTKDVLPVKKKQDWLTHFIEVFIESPVMFLWPLCCFLAFSPIYTGIGSNPSWPRIGVSGNGKWMDGVFYFCKNSVVFWVCVPPANYKCVWFISLYEFAWILLWEFASVRYLSSRCSVRLVSERSSPSPSLAVSLPFSHILTQSLSFFFPVASVSLSPYNLARQVSPHAQHSSLLSLSSHCCHPPNTSTSFCTSPLSLLLSVPQYIC